jgi:hypothetical protein
MIKNPLIIRSVIIGVIIGTMIALVTRFIQFNFIYMVLFCGLLAFSNYKYVWVPIFGLISGAIGSITFESINMLIWGNVPFITTISYLRYYSPNTIVGILLVWIGFPLAGFLGPYIVIRRSGASLDYGQSNVDIIEKKVFNYIKKHNNQVRISECALELDLKESEVEKILQSLQQKGLLLKK